jgi:hypothetical protein
MMQDRLREQFLRDQEALIKKRALVQSREAFEPLIPADRPLPFGWWIVPSVILGLSCWLGLFIFIWSLF